jgi:hypothetical protein
MSRMVVRRVADLQIPREPPGAAPDPHAAFVSAPFWRERSVSKTRIPASRGVSTFIPTAQKWCERGDLNSHALSGTGS